MARDDTNNDTLALGALVWTLEDPARAERLLDLTGLDPRALRASAGAPATLAAVLGFLENHEADLVACADAIGCTPGDLVAARARLERGA
ncbi:DUF3572 family protein [Sphingomonas sp.]|uniref:DUF3572 family protein n=1 Tax=Sphingomonas sp. TaxID=28214 RepID=UPI002DD61B5B|nr:DUF3572 family protein [Sphingomonas sp.]